MNFTNGMKLQELLHPVIAGASEPEYIDDVDNDFDMLRADIHEQTNKIYDLVEQNKASAQIANTINQYAADYIISKANGIDFFK